MTGASPQQHDAREDGCKTNAVGETWEDISARLLPHRAAKPQANSSHDRFRRMDPSPPQDLRSAVGEVALCKALVTRILCLLEEIDSAQSRRDEASLLAEQTLESLSSLHSFLDLCAPTPSSCCFSPSRGGSAKTTGRRKNTRGRRWNFRACSSHLNLDRKIVSTLEDGQKWRKYGQKRILGSKFPRTYYRCSHKISRGCRAMRQAQRMDDDPSLYSITYFHQHTCLDERSKSKTREGRRSMGRPEAAIGEQGVAAVEMPWPVTPTDEGSDHGHMVPVLQSPPFPDERMPYMEPSLLDISNLSEEELRFFHFGSD